MIGGIIYFIVLFKGQGLSWYMPEGLESRKENKKP
jgi:hypothetical protein